MGQNLHHIVIGARRCGLVPRPHSDIFLRIKAPVWLRIYTLQTWFKKKLYHMRWNLCRQASGLIIVAIIFKLYRSWELTIYYTMYEIIVIIIFENNCHHLFRIIFWLWINKFRFYLKMLLKYRDFSSGICIWISYRKII